MASPTPVLTETIGKYRLVRELGRGGMGVVYEAVDGDLNRRVALKFLSEGLFPEATQLKMFEREVEAMAAIRHPNVVAIYDVGRADNRRYYAMAYVEGCTLERLMDGMGAATRRGESVTVQEMVTRARNLPAPSPGERRVGKSRAIPVNQALNIMGKILSALEQVHNRGIVHRDIKPSNIMMDDACEPLLMDFGLARVLDPNHSQSLTQTGQVMGTPAYMSPEQATGARGVVNEKSDLYSLGAVFFEMLTGEPPLIPSGSPYADIQRILDREPVRVRRLNPSVPKDLETVCHKALEKDPERRYRTAGAFAKDLERYTQGDPVLARPPSLFYKVRKKIAKQKLTYGAGLAILAGLAGFAGFWFRSERALLEKERALREEKARAEGRWILAYQNDFNAGALDSARWEYLHPELNTLVYAVEEGRLVLKNSGKLFSRLALPGNIRLEFLASAENGAEISGYLKSDSARSLESDNYYHFCWTLASCKWQKGRDGRRVDPDFFMEKNAPDLTLSPGAFHKIRVQSEDGTCRFFVDDSLYAETRDHFYLDGLADGYWGFRCVGGAVRIDDLRVYRQIMPERIEIDKMAGLYIAEGNADKAISTLTNIFLNYEDGRLLAGAMGFLPALDRLAADRKIFEIFLSNPAVAGKIARCPDASAVYHLLENAFLKVPGELNPEIFFRAVDQFASRLPAGDRFQLLVFLGMMTRQIGDDSLSRRYLRMAREAGKEERPPDEAGPVERKAGGLQKFVPSGYFSPGFGRSIHVAAFSMDSTEVTQEHYTRIMGAGHSFFQKGAELPADQVSFFEAILFCNARSKREGLDTCYRISKVRDTAVGFINPFNKLRDLVRGPVFDVSWDTGKNGYRLPTADEFGYAACAGLPPLFLWWKESAEISDFAWLAPGSGGRSHNAARKKPNRFGLYDLIGNVWEYCWPGEFTGEGVVFSVSPISFRSGIGLGFTQIATTLWKDNLLIDGLGWPKNYDQGLRCVRREPAAGTFEAVK